MKTFKHNKLKNTGIIFEILSRKFVNETLSGKRLVSSFLIKKHFNSNSELIKELRLYQSVMERGMDADSADQLIKTVQEAHRSVDKVKLSREKYNLIKDITKFYENTDSFFKTRVTDYKLLASTYNILEHNPADNPAEYVNNRKYIKETVCSPIGNTLSDFEVYLKKQDPYVRTVGFQILVEKFDDQYKDLTDSQKKVLRTFINEGVSSPKFKDFFYSEILRVSKVINEKIKSEEDTVTSVKLKEVVNLFENVVSSPVIKNDYITALMKCYTLIGE
jgi:uncharacterized membrane-anchored protein YhcB (DUF1043 family)